jgi:hypothetical protein
MEMEIEKKHFLKSYKNEKDAIDAVQQIKSEMENPVQESSSGYNFEIASEEPFSINEATPGGETDFAESAKDEYEDEPVENPDALANEPIDLERPLPERAMHNRIR